MTHWHMQLNMMGTKLFYWTFGYLGENVLLSGSLQQITHVKASALPAMQASSKFTSDCEAISR